MERHFNNFRIYLRMYVFIYIICVINYIYCNIFRYILKRYHVLDLMYKINKYITKRTTRREKYTLSRFILVVLGTITLSCQRRGRQSMVLLLKQTLSSYLHTDRTETTLVSFVVLFRSSSLFSTYSGTAKTLTII